MSGPCGLRCLLLAAALTVATLGAGRLAGDDEAARGGTVVGLVVDQAGKPLAEAEIVLVPIMRFVGATPTDDPRSTTGADGRFEVASIEPGNYDLRVRKPGFAPGFLPVREMVAAAVRLDVGRVVLVPGVELAGQVVGKDGKPLAGVTVSLDRDTADPFDWQDQPPAQTDAEGRFTLRDLAPGRALTLWTSGEEYPLRSHEGLQVPAKTGTGEPLRIVLEKGIAVAGRVVDESGRPIAGANVELSLADLDSHHATSDEAGRFRFVANPGQAQLRARASGFAAPEPLTLEITPAGSVDDLEIVLPAGAVVEGRVTSPDGRPVPGLSVGLEVDRRAARLASYRALRKPGAPASSALATSDGEGFYRLENVPLGRRQIFLYDQHLQAKAVREVDIVPGTNVVDFTTEAAFTVAGSVIDGAGQPVADVWLELRSAEKHNSQMSADGTFLFRGVVPGRYELHALKKGFGGSLGPVPVEIVSEDVTGLVVAIAPGGAITGEIRGLSEVELAKLILKAYNPNFPQMTHTVTTARPDGTYRIPELIPGPWRLTASVPGKQKIEEAVVLEPDQAEVRLDFDFAVRE